MNCIKSVEYKACEEGKDFEKVYATFEDKDAYRAFKSTTAQYKRCFPQTRQIAFKDETMQVLLIVNKDTSFDVISSMFMLQSTYEQMLKNPPAMGACVFIRPEDSANLSDEQINDLVKTALEKGRRGDFKK